MRTKDFVSHLLLLISIYALAVSSANSSDSAEVANWQTTFNSVNSSTYVEDRLWTPEIYSRLATADTHSNNNSRSSQSKYHKKRKKRKQADLSLRKSVNNPRPDVGEFVTFTITVKNDGPAGTDYAVADVIPRGYTHITNISKGGHLEGNVITWKHNWIDAGVKQTFSFRALVKEKTGAKDEYKNVAQIIKSNRPDPDSKPNNDDGDQSEDDEDFAIVEPQSNVADFSLHKNVDNRTPNIGDVVTFTISVKNYGPAGGDYDVQDLLPPGFSKISYINRGGILKGNKITWKGQWIGKGETQVFKFRATVNSPKCVADEYKNIAQIIKSNRPDPDSTPNNDDGDQSEDDEDSVVVIPNTDICDTNNADLSLQKTVDNKTPNIGDVVTFKIKVKNDGPSGADYHLEDVVPSGFSNITGITRNGALAGNTITWKRQWIDKGEIQVFKFHTTVNSPKCVASEYKNVAQIIKSNRPDPDSTPNNDDGDQSEDDEDSAAVIPNTNICDIGTSDLSLNKTVNNATPNVGDTVTFSIVVSNAGPDAATNVGVSDIVPVGYSNISNVSNGGSVNGNNISWNVASIASGASVALSFSAEVLAPTGVADEYKNTAQVSASDQSDPDSTPNNDDGDQSEDDEDSASVIPGGSAGVADLMLTKSVDNATPNVGEVVTFSIVVSNAGPDAATNVGVSDIVPVGYSNISNVSNGGSVNGNNISWSVASIASGASVALSFTAEVLAPTGVADEYKNTAQASASDQSDPDSTPNNDDGDQSEDDEDSASVIPGGSAGVADLMLTKSVDNATPNVGEVVTFSIVVSNAGPDAATNVGVSDIVPVGYSNISNVSNGGSVNGNNISWSVASIASGASVALSFSAEVLAPTGVADEYKNTAQVSASDQSDPDSTPNNDDGDQSEDDEDSASVIPGGSAGVADLMLTKSVDNATPNVGEVVTFSIVVSNAGPDAATNVGVSDIVPVGYSNISNVSNGGSVNGNNISWNVASIASGASVALSFTAEVLAPTGVADEYKNTAQVSASDQSDPDSTPNNDDGDQSEDDEDSALVVPQIDPTGRFYCEDTGEILTGGSVAFSSSNGGSTTDFLDGTTGEYRSDFIAPAAGTMFTMAITPPPGTILSVTRPVNPTPIAPAGAVPVNLGSTEQGNTGFLVDFSAAANTPWYDTFTIDPGDPIIINNNIPVTNCATSSILLRKTAAEQSVTIGSLVQYEINARVLLPLPLTDIDIVDNIPGGFVYVADSAIIIRAGADGELNTIDDVVTNAIVTGTDPITFEDIDFAAGEELIIRYFLQVTSGVVEGQYENTAQCFNQGNLAVCNQAVASVEVSQDPILEKTTIIGKVWDDIDQDGWQDNANASNIVVKHLNDDSEGINIESIPGRSDQLDPIELHQENVTVAMSNDHNNPVVLTSAEGTRLVIDQTGKVTAEHTGMKAKGLTGQDLQVASVIDNGKMHLTITNHGLHEAGIPGVRIASVEGLLVETDEYGRYHLADIDGGRWERGRNFILKVDPLTLPEGAEFTTENPRVLRITQGLMSKINFGVKLPKQDAVYKLEMQEQHKASRHEIVKTRELDGIVDPIHFASGKADITDTYIAKLERAISSLSDKDNVRIHVVGHTDTQLLTPATAAKFKDNYGLSIARAEEVAAKLRSELGLKVTSVEISGRGPDEPVASNDNPEGMAKNRRVETSLLFDERISKKMVATSYEKIAAGRSDVLLPKGGRVWVVEDPTKIDLRLDVIFHSAVAVDKGGKVSAVSFNNYSNYLAYIDRWEVTIYNDSDVDLIYPIAKVSGERSNFLAIHELQLDASTKLDDSLWYVLRVHDSKGRMDETVPKHLAVVDAELAGMEPISEEQQRELSRSIVGKNSLSNQRIPIHGSRVRLNGSGIDAGYILRINDLSIPISEKGTFATEQHLPIGTHSFEVNVSDGIDDTTSRNLNVDVKGKHFFMVGLANLTVGENSLSGSVEPLGEDDHFDEDVWIDGRVAFYLKGKVKGKYLITAQLDTTEDELRNLGDRLDDEDPRRLFRKLDPDKYYAVYGDDSTTIDDTDSQGMFYLRVDWDKSMALWGNYNTDITGTEFSQYNRSLYGAKLEHRNVDTTEFGDHKHEVHAFASQAQNVAAHNEFVATGGSLYYLRDTDIVQGSEKVWVEVRNRDTEQVTENIALKHGQDYDIDYLQGRIILTRPLSQVDIGNGPNIIKDQPLEGDDVFLLVDYEYNPESFDADDVTAGLRGKAWLNQYIGIGGTYINEERNGEDYELKGADVTLKAGKGTYIKLEYAESDANQTNQNFISNNGGINFNNKTNTLDENSDGEALGIEARVNFAEMTGNKQQGYLMAWWKDRDANFSSTARLDDGIETTDTGLEGVWQATDNLKLSTRITNLDKRGEGEFTAASIQGDYSLTDRLTLGAEIRYEDEEDDTGLFEDTEATLGGLALRYKLTPDTEVYGSAQAVIADDNDYENNAGVTIGASRQLNTRLALKGEVTTGDRGEAIVLGGEYAVTPNTNISINAGFGEGAASQIGTNYVTANGMELYGSYAVDPDRTDSGSNMFTFGTKRRFQNGLTIFTESQFGEGDEEQSIGRTYGLDYDLTEQWRLSASIQSNDLDRDLGDIDRRAATVGAKFRNKTVQFGSVLEYREDDDRSTDLDNTQWLTSNTIEWQKSENLRLLGKLDLSTTHSDSNKGDEAKYAEIDLGFAYRPATYDRWNILGKYTFLYDLGSSGQDDVTPEERAHIFSLEGIYDLNQKWELGAKYAHREGDLRLTRGSGPWFESGAHLAVIRSRYHFIKKWDALFEYRWLESESEDDEKHGALVAAYRHLGKHFKVGAGYNFTDFNDDLTDNDYDSDGWFIDIVGKY